MKKYALYLILFVYVFHCEKLFALETTIVGNALNSYNFFEYVKECFDKNKLQQIIQENHNNSCSFRVIYDLEGTLKSFFRDTPFEQYFTEEEWETLFDYFYQLPPLPLNNVPKKILIEDDKYATDLNSILDYVYKFLIRTSFNPVIIGWSMAEPDSISTLTCEEEMLNNPNFAKRFGGIPAVYGNTNWVEMKRRYYQAVKDGEFKQKSQMKYWEPIFNAQMDKEGYYWDKIPINNYSVNLQLPIGARVVNAPDTLSSLIYLPDSCRLSIQYSKGSDGLKLFDGENNQRNRRILSLLVKDRYMLLWGKFEQHGKTTYWLRIRYRYGITMTLYTTNLNILEQYFKTIIAPVTIVLRPKFKNIYLND